MIDGDKDDVTEVRFEEEFQSEKWNVQLPVTTYNDEQYEKNFVSEEWTKEETDLLMELCRDYDMRWILIADRYDSASVLARTSTISSDDPNTKNYPPRSMEALKARYYAISSKMLEVDTPASQMTGEEFQLWEKMRNFDAKAEVTRKVMAEKLFDRTKDEADEEKVLLEELYRITKHEEDFIKLRKDLYSRLETAPSLKRNERGDEQSTALYQTSQGLSHLLSTLLAREKRLKRPQANGADAASAVATPSDTKGRHQTYNRRETMDSQADDGGPLKKGSISQPVVRTLTSAEEVKYGVSHPQERLTSGVMFRHEKINRITTAKSQVQTQKIQAALTELGIPARLLMPTERVCREFERLVTEVQILLDTRRVSEKVATEVKVLEEHKRIRLGQPKEGEAADTNGGDAMDVDDSMAANNQNDDDKTKAEAGDESVMRNGNGNGEEEGDEDAEGNVEQSGIDDEDDQTFARRQEDDDDENVVDEEDEQEEEQEEEDENEDDEDDDAPGLEDLERANQVTDDEEENEDNAEIGDSEAEDEEDDEPEDEDDNDNDNEGAEAEVDESMANGDEDDEDAAEEPSRPVSAHSAGTRSHKRSASVLSDASKAGSNRSGMGRKKRR